MNLREKLENLKNKISNYKELNRDFEFYADLDNHTLGNQNIYRLRYINYHRIGESYGIRPDNVGVINWPFKPFLLPKGMSRDDAFKVLSYLTDYIEANLGIEVCSMKSVALLEKTLDLERLDFRRVNISTDKIEEDIIDLFTVTGRLLLFKNSKYYSKYFEWYIEGVTFEEVEAIYKKSNIEFSDLTDWEILQIQDRNYNKVKSYVKNSKN